MKQKTTKILLLENNEAEVHLVKDILKKSNSLFEIKVALTKIEFTTALKDFIPDVIVSEYSLPSLDSKEALAIVKTETPKAPFIILTSQSEKYAGEMMIEGAYRLLKKEHLEHLPDTITQALDRAENGKLINGLTKNYSDYEKLLNETEKLARIGSWQFNYQSGIGKWSDEAYRLLGHKPGEVAPSFKSFLDRIHPDDIEQVITAHSEIELRNLTTQKFEHRIIDFRTNEIRFLCTKLIFERDEKGHPLQAMGFIQDITADKLVQERLLRKKMHLLTSQRLGNIGSWEIDLTDPESVFEKPIYRSDEIFRIFGIDSDKLEINGNELMKKIHPEDREMVIQKFKDAIENHKVLSVDYRIIPNNKTQKIVHTRGEIIYGKDLSAPLKMIGTTQDITIRKEEEEAFRKSEANLRTIFDNTSTSYILVDPEFKIVSYNKAALDGFQRDVKKTIEVGNSILDLIADDRKARALDMYKRVFEGEQFKIEDSYTHPEGSQIWYYMQLLPVFGGNNKVLNMIVYLRDITERKQAEIEREKITTDLIQRNRDLEQFSYILSHNLRLPVANIMGLIDNFGISSLQNEEQRDAISAIYISIRALDDVILDLNKILDVKNKNREDKKLVKLPDILNDIKTNLGFAIKKDNAILDADFSGSDQIFAVKSYLSSIFYNLILNSIKFRQPGLTPNIRIKCENKDGKTLLSFADNGLGIDMCKKEKELFGLYKRFHPHINGKGMGLFMVKTQVEAMGGKISATSDVNKGTTFTIEFPEMQEALTST